MLMVPQVFGSSGLGSEFAIGSLQSSTSTSAGPLPEHPAKNASDLNPCSVSGVRAALGPNHRNRYLEASNIHFRARHGVVQQARSLARQDAGIDLRGIAGRSFGRRQFGHLAGCSSWQYTSGSGLSPELKMALYPDSAVWVLGLKADLDGLLANLRVTRCKALSLLSPTHSSTALEAHGFLSLPLGRKCVFRVACLNLWS